MELVITTCPKFLSLLGQFYERLSEAPPAGATLVEPGAVPEPYRGLLVHHNDMTPTLEQFHREKLTLTVLHRQVADDSLARHIVLEGARTGRPVEYGAIRVYLDTLGGEARRQVLQCRLPLGSILKSYQVAHESCPGGFFRIRPNALMTRVLRLNGAPWLYGRCNCISDAAGRTIAEVVEILPNMETRG